MNGYMFLKSSTLMCNTNIYQDFRLQTYIL